MLADHSQVEQVAKFFVAYNHDPTTLPAAQGNKLKAMLPAADNNFHTALDQLEYELVRLHAYGHQSCIALIFNSNLPNW